MTTNTKPEAVAEWRDAAGTGPQAMTRARAAYLLRAARSRRGILPGMPARRELPNRYSIGALVIVTGRPWQAPADMSHLSSLRVRLSHERARLAASKTEGERERRAVWVAQAEREVAGELAFLGLPPDAPASADDMTPDELLAALEA